MGKRQKDLDTAKMMGMSLALGIVREHGIEALEKDIRARERTGIQPPRYFYDLDKCTDDIRAWCLKRITIAFIAACRDEFGFGAARMGRLLNRVAMAFDLVRSGEASWWDYSQEIDKEMGLMIETDPSGVVRIKVEESKKRGAKRDGRKTDQVHA